MNGLKKHCQQHRLRPAALASACFLAAFLVCAVPTHADSIHIERRETSTQTLNRAVALLKAGHLSQADEVLQHVQETDPGFLSATLGRAQIAVDQHQLVAADHMVSAVLAKQDRLPEAHNMKGFLLLLHKDSGAARREFSRAIELQPQYVTPRLYLATLDRTAGDLAGAAAEYKAITQAAPRLPAGYLGEAEALNTLHRENDALQVLESWKSADPRSLLPYRVLANIYLADHKPEQAVGQLQAALGKSPKDSLTLSELGDVYAACGDTQRAGAAYTAALSSDPHNSKAALGLGGLEASAGQNEKALGHLRQVLTSDPNNAIAANDIAWVLVSQGRELDQALVLAKVAVQSDPSYVDAHDTLGWVRYSRGEYKLAVTELKQAHAMQPASPEIAAHLGLAYARTGDRQAALALLKQALAATPAIPNRPELERVEAELSMSKTVASLH
jgi:cellulose synthase operon protein C